MVAKELPKDPMILLSYINTMLRDHYGSLSLLCDDFEIPEDDIRNPLSVIGYEYDATLNKFV